MCELFCFCSLLDGVKEYLMRTGDEMEVYTLIEQLPALPEELKIKQASAAWSYIWTRFTTPAIEF